MSKYYANLVIEGVDATKVLPRNCVGPLASTGGARAGRKLTVCLVARLLACFAMPLTATAHDGRHGHDHDKWHADFYSKLMRPDTQTSCCNLADCRPTEIRTVAEHYEVLKDDRWIRVPSDKIVKITAPDGGAHICAPPSDSTLWQPDDVFCIIMPFEI